MKYVQVINKNTSEKSFDYNKKIFYYEKFIKLFDTVGYNRSIKKNNIYNLIYLTFGYDYLNAQVIKKDVLNYLVKHLFLFYYLNM